MSKKIIDEQNLASNYKDSYNNKHYVLLPFLISLLMIVSTIIGWQINEDIVKQETKKLFEQKSFTVEDIIQKRLRTYVQTLYSLRAFYEESETMDQDRWSSYIRRTGVFETYPGISSYAYIARVKASDKDKFTKNMPKGFKAYPEALMDEYYLTQYIEPYPELSYTIGFNMLSEEQRAETYHRARDTDHPVSSGRLTLLNGITGFQVVIPVYQKDLEIDTVEQKQQALEGFTIANFRADDLFRRLLGENAFSDLNISIYCHKDTDPDHLLYQNQPFKDGYQSNLQTEKHIQLNGDTWTIKIRAKQDFGLAPSQKNLPKIVLFGGIFTSLILLGIFLKNLRG